MHHQGLQIKKRTIALYLFENENFGNDIFT